MEATQAQGELNRLAKTSGLGPNRAAAIWVGIDPTLGYSLQYLLNVKAGTNGLSSQGAANVIAGTNGLALRGALSTIPTPP